MQKNLKNGMLVKVVLSNKSHIAESAPDMRIFHIKKVKKISEKELEKELEKNNISNELSKNENNDL